MDVRRWIIDWFKENVGVEEDEIEEKYNENYLEIGWIDSFKFISFITEVENNFNVNFSDEQFQDRTFLTISGFINSVESKIDGKMEVAVEEDTEKLVDEYESVDIRSDTIDDKNNVPLFRAKGFNIYYSDFINALRESGVRKGDIIFVHSDVHVFGRLGNTDHDFILNSLIKCLKETVGDSGIIIMPAFTYSFCRNEVFDVEKSPATVGVLAEYFRKQPDVSRTEHPIYSVGIWGKDKSEWLNIGKDSFDSDSIFGKWYKKKGKLVFFGASFQSCTFIHFIEQSYNVPYRYIKKFGGIIRKDDKEYEDECTFFVRYLDRNVISDFTKFENYLLEKKLLKEVKIGHGKISTIEADALYREGYKLLERDLYFFLKEEPKQIN